MKRPATRFLARPDELRALVSPIRQEIVDVVSARGSMSVAELAAAIGRPADALYFHLRALQRARLVRRTFVRRRGQRQMALFRTAAPELKLRYEPASGANRRNLTAIVASMLRLGARDFRRGLQQEGVRVTGPRRELCALRRTARLTPPQIKDVNRLIDRLLQQFAGVHDEGPMYAITVLLTPVKGRR
jgi:DNA-binding transcriptional ArsR family regulator